MMVPFSDLTSYYVELNLPDLPPAYQTRLRKVIDWANRIPTRTDKGTESRHRRNPT